LKEKIGDLRAEIQMSALRYERIESVACSSITFL